MFTAIYEHLGITWSRIVIYWSWRGIVIWWLRRYIYGCWRIVHRGLVWISVCRWRRWTRVVDRSLIVWISSEVLSTVGCSKWTIVKNNYFPLNSFRRWILNIVLFEVIVEFDEKTWITGRISINDWRWTNYKEFINSKEL